MREDVHHDANLAFPQFDYFLTWASRYFTSVIGNLLGFPARLQFHCFWKIGSDFRWSGIPFLSIAYACQSLLKRWLYSFKQQYHAFLLLCACCAWSWVVVRLWYKDYKNTININNVWTFICHQVTRQACAILINWIYVTICLNFFLTYIDICSMTSLCARKHLKASEILFSNCMTRLLTM